MDNIKDPLFRFFEREVNAGARLLAEVRRDLQDVLQVCVGDKKPTNHHRLMMADLAKGKSLIQWWPNENIGKSRDRKPRLQTERHQIQSVTFVFHVAYRQNFDVLAVRKLH